MSQFNYLLQKENLTYLAVLEYTYIKIGCIHIDKTVFNRGNLLNWLHDHGLNLYENLQNLAAQLCAYIKLFRLLHKYKHEEYH